MTYTQDTEARKKRFMLALVGFLFMFAFAYVLNSNQFIRLKSDIYLRWYATEKLFSEGRNLYDERNGQEVDDIVYGTASGLEPGFYYPAHLLLFTGPLALLPYRAAHLVWTIAVQFFYLAGIWLMMRQARWPDHVNGETVFLALCALFLPHLQHTIWGQFNTIGVLSLVGCYLALRHQNLGWAGVLATGLTIKPHGYVLTLAFLLFWAVIERSRWRFLAGFFATGVGLWLIPALWQPMWVLDFWLSLDDYVPVTSVVDDLWNPYNLTAIVLVAGTLLVLFRQRHADHQSIAFLGCLLLSLAMWSLVVPIWGMFHILVFPPFIIPLLAFYRHKYDRYYRPVILTFLLLYVAGLSAFLLGLSRPEWYGLHITWSEAVYNGLLPLFVGCLTWPLLQKSKETT
jgi:hypothetical protein